jgi:diketogulonate reductase-like aldo/keto reductase
MHSLVEAGRIGRWGVSNFDVDDMVELAALADDCATNQVWYSLGERGAEFALLPWMNERRMPLMAYSPIDQGRFADDPTLAAIARPRGLTAAQVALAWVVSQKGVVAIPKASSVPHLRANLAAADLELTDDERRRIDAQFPAPARKTSLAMN